MQKVLISAIAGLAVAAILAGVQSTPVQAQDAAAAIDARQKAMKAFGGHNRVIVAYLKEGKGTPADVATHAKAIASDAGKIAMWFPKGTGEDDGVGKTRAKAEIWTKHDAFEKAAMHLGELATKVAMAADSGDKAAIGAAFGMMGKDGCGGCHSTFRAEEKK